MNDFYKLCMEGNKEHVDEAISKFMGNGLKGACKGGHVRIVYTILYGEIEFRDDYSDNYLVNGTDYSEALMDACKYGHYNIVDLMINIDRRIHDGVIDYCGGLKNACEGGHANIIELLLSKGAKNVKAADMKAGFLKACEGGHVNIIELMLSKGADNVKADYMKAGFSKACERGHDNIIELMLSKEVDNMKAGYMKAGFPKACRYGNLNIIKKMMDNKYEPNAEDLIDGMIQAVHDTGKNMNVINFLIDNKGFNSWELILSGILCSVSNDYMCDECDSEFLDNLMKKDGRYAYSYERELYMKQKSCVELQKNSINFINIALEKYSNAVCDIINYQENHTLIIKLLEAGLDINKILNIDGIDELVKNLKQYKKTTYNELYQYMPKELANIICEYCLL